MSVSLPTEAPRYVLDPRNGDRLVTFTPEEASLISDAMEKRGLGDRVVETLYSLQFLRNDGQKDLDRASGRLKESIDPATSALEQGPHCMHLDLNGQQFQFSLAGGGPIHVLDPLTGDRIIRFSVKDAGAIRETLLRAGFDTVSVMKVLFDLRDSSATGAVAPSGNLTIKMETGRKQIILDPPCGGCLNGGVCNINNQWNCCNYGGGGCSSCRVCG